MLLVLHVTKDSHGWLDGCIPDMPSGVRIFFPSFKLMQKLIMLINIYLSNLFHRHVI